MMVKSDIVIYSYVSLWCFYELQALLGMAGGVVSLVAMMLLMSVSFYYMLKVHLIRESLPPFFLALDLLMAMFTIYGVIYIYSDYYFTRSIVITKPYNYLKAIYNSLLPIYFFYYHARMGKLTKSTMQMFAYLFFFVIVLSFFEKEFTSQTDLLAAEESREMMINNRGYAVLCMFPLLCFFKTGRWIRYLSLVIVIGLLLLGMKRGSIAIGLGCLVVYLYYMLKDETKRMKLFSLLSIVSILLFTIYLFSYLYQNNAYFNYRVEMTLMGDSSGRNVLYDNLWDYFLYKTDDFSFLLGGGANSTLSVTTNYAHNDWLEIAVNQGVFGVLIYLFYWLSFFYSLWLMRTDRDVFQPFLLLFIIYFARTFFSMSYGAIYVYSSSVIGYCLGLYYLKKQKTHEDCSGSSQLSLQGE